ASDMVAPPFKPRGLFVQARAMGSFDGTVEMVARFFVAVFGAVKPRFVHCVVGSFCQRLQPHHVDACDNARLVHGPFRRLRIFAFAPLTPSMPPIAEGHSPLPNLPLTQS